MQDKSIDVESGVLDKRSWRWLNQRILSLISTPSSRLYRVLNPPKEVTPHGLSRPA